MLLVTMQDMLLDMLNTAASLPEVAPLLMQLGSAVFERMAIQMQAGGQFVNLLSPGSQVAADVLDRYGLAVQAYKFGANGLVQLLAGDNGGATCMLSLSLSALDLMAERGASDAPDPQLLLDIKFIVAQLAVAARLAAVDCVDEAGPGVVPAECISILESITDVSTPQYHTVSTTRPVPHGQWVQAKLV